jgi:hypothetical protein
MPSAGRSAPIPLALRSGFVVEHEEMVFVPVIGVIAHNSRLALVVEVLNSHEEYALIDGFEGGAGLFAEFGRPELAMVVVVAGIALKAPWVSHSHQSVSIGELDSPQYYIGVGSLQLALVVLVVLGSWHSLRVEEHHLVRHVVSVDFIPKPVYSALSVIVLVEGRRGAIEGSGGISWVSRYQVLVVTVNFGKDFL